MSAAGALAVTDGVAEGGAAAWLAADGEAGPAHAPTISVTTLAHASVKPPRVPQRPHTSSLLAPPRAPMMD